MRLLDTLPAAIDVSFEFGVVELEVHVGGQGGSNPGPVTGVKASPG